MYTTIGQFAEEWEREGELTARMMDALSDESLPQAIDDKRRTLGQIAWHLVKSLEYMTYCGLVFEGADGEERAPASAAHIATQYRRLHRNVLQAVQTQWSDEDLSRQVELMGEPWANGASLRFAVMHQAHHRGQMTVLMRQAGLPIPEVYGQTYDSWIEQGVTPYI